MATIWLVPLALGIMGLGLLSAAWLVSRRFDRKYPHLSRKGMREIEERLQASRATAGRARIPVPPFRAEEWAMRSARDELESERLDRSLNRWGQQVARHPNPAEESRNTARR